MSERLDWISVRRLGWFSLIAVLLVIILATIYGALLPPILISCFFTYLMLPLVNLLERKKVPRSLAIALIVFGSLAVLALSAIRLAPLLYEQLINLIHVVPGAVSTMSRHWLPRVEKYVDDLSFFNPADIHTLLSPTSVVGHVASELQNNLMVFWKTGSSLVGALFYAVLIPMLTFFMLKDYGHFAHAVASLVPIDLKQPLNRIRIRIDLTLKTVLKSQAIVAAVLGVLYTIGFSIVGLQSGIAIGLISGICRLIPYGDVLVGGALSGMVLLSYGTGLGQVIGVAFVFVVVQALDGAFITPAIIGERIGLHPVVVILSVLALGDWMGFWGILLAIPVAAVVKVLLESLLPYYRASRIFQRRSKQR